MTGPFPASRDPLWGHRIIEWFVLEGTFKGHLVQHPCNDRSIFNWIRLLRAPLSLTLNVSRNGISTTSLGNLFQRFTTRKDPFQAKLFYEYVILWFCNIVHETETMPTMVSTSKLGRLQPANQNWGKAKLSMPWPVYQPWKERKIVMFWNRSELQHFPVGTGKKKKEWVIPMFAQRTL